MAVGIQTSSQRIGRLFRAALGTLALAAAGASMAEPVSAHAAQQLIARGALAWDVRAAADFSRGHLPSAVHAAVPGDGSIEGLETAASAAGIDLSREVVIYGQSADPQAQQVYERLLRAAPGRVYWLVGGVQEWTHGGRGLWHDATPRAPVPQRLAARDLAQPAVLRMAGESLRRSVDFSLAPAAEVQALRQ